MKKKHREAIPRPLLETGNRSLETVSPPPPVILNFYALGMIQNLGTQRPTHTPPNLPHNQLTPPIPTHSKHFTIDHLFEDIH